MVNNYWWYSTGESEQFSSRAAVGVRRLFVFQESPATPRKMSVYLWNSVPIEALYMCMPVCDCLPD